MSDHNSKTPYLNREDSVWTPTQENLLGLCFTQSPNPPTVMGRLRLRLHGHHIPQRDATGTPYCLRCGLNLDIEYAAIEKREKGRNVSEI